MSNDILLESTHWRLYLQPEVGVQWVAGQVRRGDDWLDVIPECRDAAASAGSARAGQQAQSPLPAANFHMLPYSNRIRDGKFRFAQTDYQLQEADNHAIHGALRKRAWRTTEQSSALLSAEYDSTLDGDVNWPWPIRASLRHTLDGPRLISEMTLTNAGDTPMPAGMGWHPYFTRLVDGASPELQLPVSGVYPDANGDCLPDGAAIALPTALDFRSRRKLDADQRIDHCLSGLQGNALIAWPDAGVELTMQASDNCTHLVLFNPDMPHFAVEPVTNANDAFNLTERGINAGATTLAPGETLSAHMILIASV